MSEVLIEKLFNYGVLGVVLAWFMFRAEKIIQNNTEALNSIKFIIENCRAVVE